VPFYSLLLMLYMASQCHPSERCPCLTKSPHLDVESLSGRNGEAPQLCLPVVTDLKLSQWPTPTTTEFPWCLNHLLPLPVHFSLAHTPQDRWRSASQCPPTLSASLSQPRRWPAETDANANGGPKPQMWLSSSSENLQMETRALVHPGRVHLHRC